MNTNELFKERLQDLQEDLRIWQAYLEEDEENYDDLLICEVEELLSAMGSLLLRLEDC